MTSRGAALDVLLTVVGPTVRLVGAGVDVSASHGGVRPGLVNALHDVRRERTRACEVAFRPRGDAALKDLAAAEAGPGVVSLWRAGELLAESFLPTPVAVALRGLVEQATGHFVALRIGSGGDRRATDRRGGTAGSDAAGGGAGRVLHRRRW